MENATKTFQLLLNKVSVFVVVVVVVVAVVVVVFVNIISLLNYNNFIIIFVKVPGDPNLCSKLGIIIIIITTSNSNYYYFYKGQIYEKLQDDNSACHWHTEAHRL